MKLQKLAPYFLLLNLGNESQDTNAVRAANVEKAIALAESGECHTFLDGNVACRRIVEFYTTEGYRKRIDSTTYEADGHRYLDLAVLTNTPKISSVDFFVDSPPYGIPETASRVEADRVLNPATGKMDNNANNHHTIKPEEPVSPKRITDYGINLEEFLREAQRKPN